jgi:uncharacterized protein YqgC (DUF456 family)
MSIFWALLFVLAVLVFWALNLLGMPGNWLIVAATVLYVWLSTSPGGGGLRWTAVAVIIGLALIGELVEFAASATGVKRAGGGRPAAVLALVGSVAGAVAGLFVGIPIPVVGSVIAALVFAGLGALGGAMLGELWTGRTWSDSFRVGHAAFWGRLFGTLAKTLIGGAMAGIAIAVVFL